MSCKNTRLEDIVDLAGTGVVLVVGADKMVPAVILAGAAGTVKSAD